MPDNVRKIERWEMGRKGELIPNANGDWVMYDDHIKAIATLTAQLAEAKEKIELSENQSEIRRLALCEQRQWNPERAEPRAKTWLGERQNWESEVTRLRESITTVEAEQDELQKELAEAKKENDELKQEVFKKDLTVENFRNLVAMKEIKLNSLHSSITTVEAERDALRKELAEAKEHIRQYGWCGECAHQSPGHYPGCSKYIPD